MCGICGVLYFEKQAEYLDNTFVIQQMTALIERRGPDSRGIWNDPSGYLQLGFRRLAILDLSPKGEQPMTSINGHSVIVFNGELYNFRQLRDELEKSGIQFRSTSDTEVALEAISFWGHDALQRFNGMFALAWYDWQSNKLILARDHAGIKPLYYLQTKDGVVFASQYDQILAHPWRKGLPISRSALALYLRMGYIPAPYAILEETHQLLPGAWLEFSPDKCSTLGRYFEFPYYQTPDLNGQEAYEAVAAAVKNSVRRQIVSDVPVGAFLSGGIDSPLITGEMQSIETNPIPAFTIGVPGSEADESQDAARYAQDFGVKHIIEKAETNNVLQLLEQVVACCSEPFADYSIFPTLLVSEIARRHVKVVLSGDGGDELFFGYVGRLGSVLSVSEDFRYPLWLRSLRWYGKKYLNFGNGYLNLRQANIGSWYYAKHNHLPETWINKIFPDTPTIPYEYNHFDYNGWKQDQTAQWLRRNEFIGHLSMVLNKVDRGSMFHSLEVRVPLLDREVIDTALRVDWRSSLDLSRRVGKLPLRRALQNHTNYQTQKKRGFTVPMSDWLRGPLRSIMAEKFLNRDSLTDLQINRQASNDFFMLHLNGKADHAWGLWLLLSLALWEEKYL